MPDATLASAPLEETAAAPPAIVRCNTAAITALGLLGPAHALIEDSTEKTAPVVVALLTGAQALAIFTIISAAFAIGRLRNGEAAVDSLLTKIPVWSCCVTGGLLVFATCIIHWKAACTLIVLSGIFLIVAFRAQLGAFRGRVIGAFLRGVDCVRNVLSKEKGRDLEMGVGEGAAAGADQ